MVFYLHHSRNVTISHFTMARYLLSVGLNYVSLFA